MPAIRGFAVRDVEYGVELADYVALREALLWTLEQALGEDLTPAIHEAERSTTMNSPVNEAAADV